MKTLPINGSIELLLMNKAAYGPRLNELEYIRKIGATRWIEEQLHPRDQDDSECLAKLQQARLLIEYDEGDSNNKPSHKESRPLTALNKSLEQLWKLVDGKHEVNWAEQTRPAEEVRCATILRAVYSRWQLKEVMTQFWHNHFNVSISKDEKIAATLPIYDRDVIRKNCFGNFRQFLEDVATSVAMGYYLDNVTSKASPANENYARELFELHTLGAENYLNHLYNRWKDVPGALSGKAVGFIDQDVYEAARSFTGWTIADGSDNWREETFPNTGHFFYYEGWHDNYQKRVLSVEFEPNQPRMADGKKVLDLVAYHPATAYRLCRKICVRLLSDNPPDSVIRQAAQTWTENQKQPDQIARTLSFILSSPEFASSYRQKIKTPLELAVSFLRGTNTNTTPNSDFFWSLSQMGYSLFDYHAPTGHPDHRSYWLSTSAMVHRWNLLNNLMFDWMGKDSLDLKQQTPTQCKTSRQIVDYWTNRLLAAPLPTAKHAELIKFMAAGASFDAPPVCDDDTDLKDRLHSLVALIAMSPEFQLR